jgi:hypothetical protein
VEAVVVVVLRLCLRVKQALLQTAAIQASKVTT